MMHNFASIEIERTKEDFEDISVTIAIRNITNNEVIKRKLSTKHDLKFDNSKRSQGAMCKQIHTNGRKILQLNRVAEVLINDKNISLLIQFFVMCFVAGLLPIAIVTRILSLIVGQINKRVNKDYK